MQGNVRPEAMERITTAELAEAFIDEQLKAENQMLWVAKMNNIRNRATKIVNTELIYT